MNTSTIKFDWNEFYEIGCALLSQQTDSSLRTSINRFYFASFCYARDFLIENNIFYNADLKDQMLSGKSIVHSATRDIFKYEHDRIDRPNGKFVHDKLKELRDYRNIVDYNSKDISGLFLMAKRSESHCKHIIEKINEISSNI